MRPPALVVAALALGCALVSRPAVARWGADTNPGAGVALVDSVRAPLAAIVKAPASERPRLIADFVATRAADAIEAVKRFRNPELLPLFHALLDHADWHVAHRALLALERMRDGTAVARAWSLVSHSEPRMREKAAITCLTLWDDAGRSAPASTPALSRLSRLVPFEGDPHVRACLEALAARIANRSTVDRVSDEVRVTTAEGLLWTPFLDGMNTASRVAPGHTAKPVTRAGGASASKLAVAKRWTTPLLRYGREEVEGTGLQPFANLRKEGRTFHTGLDVGAFLDGAGFYACAQGVVKWVHTGSDMGTLLVVEHHVAEREVATILYMHAADVVFCKAGDVVEPGQLLGSMGLSHSFENGGHFAHLHFGAYPGPFVATHNYGYRPVVQGLRDWFDPDAALADWIERTRPPVDEPGPVAPPVVPAAILVRDRQYGKALAAATALLAAGTLDETARADAERVRDSLANAATGVVARATEQRSRGHPGAARAILTKDAALLAGLPGDDVPGKTAASWDADPSFRRDLAAEAKFEKTLAAEASLVAKKDVAAARALWEALAPDVAGTCLVDRVRGKAADASPR